MLMVLILDCKTKTNCKNKRFLKQKDKGRNLKCWKIYNGNINNKNNKKG